MTISTKTVLSVILILGFVLNTTRSLRFDLESCHAKCISEDIKSNSMNVGKYSMVNPSGEGHPLPESHKITVGMLLARTMKKLIETGEEFMKSNANEALEEVRNAEKEEKKNDIIYVRRGTKDGSLNSPKSEKLESSVPGELRDNTEDFYDKDERNCEEKRTILSSREKKTKRKSTSIGWNKGIGIPQRKSNRAIESRGSGGKDIMY